MISKMEANTTIFIFSRRLQIEHSGYSNCDIMSCINRSLVSSLLCLPQIRIYFWPYTVARKNVKSVLIYFYMLAMVLFYELKAVV